MAEHVENRKTAEQPDETGGQGQREGGREWREQTEQEHQNSKKDPARISSLLLPRQVQQCIPGPGYHGWHPADRRARKRTDTANCRQRVAGWGVAVDLTDCETLEVVNTDDGNREWNSEFNHCLPGKNWCVEHRLHNG